MYKLYSLFLIALLSFQAMAMKKDNKSAFLVMAPEMKEKIFFHFFDLEPGKILVNLIKIKLIRKEFTDFSDEMLSKYNPFMKDGGSFYVDYFYSSEEGKKHDRYKYILAIIEVKLLNFFQERKHYKIAEQLVEINDKTNKLAEINKKLFINTYPATDYCARDNDMKNIIDSREFLSSIQLFICAKFLGNHPIITKKHPMLINDLPGFINSFEKFILPRFCGYKDCIYNKTPEIFIMRIANRHISYSSMSNDSNSKYMLDFIEKVINSNNRLKYIIIMETVESFRAHIHIKNNVYEEDNFFLIANSLAEHYVKNKEVLLPKEEKFLLKAFMNVGLLIKHKIYDGSHAMAICSMQYSKFFPQNSNSNKNN